MYHGLSIRPKTTSVSRKCCKVSALHYKFLAYNMFYVREKIYCILYSYKKCVFFISVGNLCGTIQNRPPVHKAGKIGITLSDIRKIQIYSTNIFYKHCTLYMYHFQFFQ